MIAAAHTRAAIRALLALASALPVSFAHARSPAAPRNAVQDAQPERLALPSDVTGLRALLETKPSQKALVRLAYDVDARQLGAEGRLEDAVFLELFVPLRAALERSASADSFLAYFDWRIGCTLRDAGRVDEAIEHMRASVPSWPSDNPWLPWLHVEIADLVRSRAQWDVADEHVRAARALFDETSDPRLRATWHGVRGEIDLHLGRHDRAELDFAEETRLAAGEADPTWALAAFVHRVKLALARDDTLELESLTSEWESGSLREHAIPAERARVAALFAIGAAERARLDGRIDDALRGRLTAARSDAALGTATRQKLDVVIAGCLVATGDAGGAREVLHALRAEIAGSPARPIAGEIAALEARLALDHPHDADVAAERQRTLAALQEAFDAFLAASNAAPAREGGIGFLHFADRQLLGSELVRMRLALGGADGVARAVDTVLRVQSLGMLARALHAPTPTLDEVRTTLAEDGTALLVYFPGKLQSHAFVIDGRGADAFELARGAELERAATRLLIETMRGLRSASGAPDDAWRAAVETASLQLLPAALCERLSSARALRVVGSEAIGYVPFEALRFGDAGELGARFDVGYLPSLAVGCALSARARATEGAEPREAVALIAAPALGAQTAERYGVAPLDADAAHWDDLVQPHGERARVARGAHATSTALAELAGARTAVLHVVAHGIYAVERERPAGILLAGEGGAAREWWTENAAAVAWPPLVVLSACGPWRGPLRRGDDGRHHWVGALLEHGASTVVTSYVDLELDAALALLHPFHRELARGASPAAALRRARAAVDGGDSPRARLQARLVHAVGLADRPVLASAPATTSIAPARARSAWPWVLGALGVAALGLLVASRVRRQGAAR